MTAAQAPEARIRAADARCGQIFHKSPPARPVCQKKQQPCLRALMRKIFRAAPQAFTACGAALLIGPFRPALREKVLLPLLTTCVLPRQGGEACRIPAGCTHSFPARLFPLAGKPCGPRLGHANACDEAISAKPPMLRRLFGFTRAERHGPCLQKPPGYCNMTLRRAVYTARQAKKTGGVPR